MKFLLLGILWTTFFWMLVRSIWTRKIRAADSHRFLFQMFLSCTAVSLWGEESEDWLDQYFQGLPVTVYLKYFALLGIAHLFDNLVRESIDGWQERYRWLKAIVPLALITGILSFIVYALYEPIDKTLLRYLIIGARDGWVLPLNVLMFLPATVILWRREEVYAMQFRLLGSLITSICYFITVNSSLMAAGFAFYSFERAEQAAKLASPFIIIGIICFIPMLMPHRGINFFVYLRRFYLYYRLNRLKDLIVPQRNSEATSIGSLEELDLAIYRTVIAILDYYPPLEQSNRELYQAISTRVQANPEYEDLLQAMAKL